MPTIEKIDRGVLHVRLDDNDGRYLNGRPLVVDS
jgi:hypothetical protein